jgi:predicted transcriptional regulator
LFNETEIAVGRGQLVTGIDKVSSDTGITQQRIRSRLRTLENLGMITRKTTNKFSIITIRNYDQYQKTGGGEKQADQQAEVTKCLIGLPQQSSNNQATAYKKLKNKRIYVEDSDELRLATLLLGEVQKNRQQRGLSPVKQPDLQSWAWDIDLIVRVDRKEPEQIERVIRWCQGDDFWWKNILSTTKLRKQFDRLEAEMVSKAQMGKGRVVEYPDFTGCGGRDD